MNVIEKTLTRYQRPLFEVIADAALGSTVAEVDANVKAGEGGLKNAAPPLAGLESFLFARVPMTQQDEVSGVRQRSAAPVTRDQGDVLTICRRSREPPRHRVGLYAAPLGRRESKPKGESVRR